MGGSVFWNMLFVLPSNSFKYFYTNTFEFYCEILPNNIFSHDLGSQMFSSWQDRARITYILQHAFTLGIYCTVCSPDHILHCTLYIMLHAFALGILLSNVHCALYTMHVFHCINNKGFWWLYWYVYMNFELRYTLNTTISNVHCQIMYVVWYMP